MKSRRLLSIAVAALLTFGVCVAVAVAPSDAAAPEPLTKVKPDAVLKPGQSVTFTNKTPLIGGALSGGPEECRGGINPGDPLGTIAGLSCKVYRLKLDLDKNPEADNVVFIRADFNQVRLPSPDLVVIGPNLTPINGIDVYVYNFNDHYLGQGHGGSLLFPGDEGDPYDLPTGASSYNVPEVGSFKATQPEFDIVVSADPGINTGFTLKLSYSNEIFDSPFEALDPSGILDEVDTSNDTTDFGDNIPAPVDDSLAQLPVDTDSDIAGVGLGVNEQFDPSALEALDRATRNISATQKPPSGIALILGLGVMPAVVVLGALLALRRRRHALI